MGLLTFMADDLNPNPIPPAADPTPPPDGQGKNPADQPKGADTPPANPLEAKKDDAPKVDVTTTPEFKTALTKAIEAKIPQLAKQARKDVAKELSGEKEGEPTVEQLKSEMTTLKTENMRLKGRDQLEEFVGDKRNQIQVRNVRGLFKYVKDDLEYDDNGKVTNFKDVLAAAKSEASEFFGGTSSSIDAGNGARQQPAMDMNAWMRGTK